MDGLEQGQARLTDAVADLRTHMGVLHEEVIDRIKASAEDDSLRIEMNRRFDEVLTTLRDHAVPGDAADRYFASRLNDHERPIRDLER